MYPHRVGSSQSNLVRRRYGSESENGDDANGSYVIPASTVRSSTLSADPKEDAAVPADFASSASSVSSMSLSNSSRDRTGEFLNAVRSFQGRQMNGGLAAPPPTGASLSSSRKAQLSQQAGEFMTIARSIGRDIAATYTKLEKLTLLARRKTLFDDRPQEIQKLTVIIKEDMATLNKQIARLQLIAKAQRGQGLQGSNQKSHSSNVVVALQSKLATMTSSFKEVLEVRTENLKESRNRQDMFGQSGHVTSSLPQSAVKGFHAGSVLAAAAAAAEDDERRTNGDVAIDFGSDPGQQRALMTDQTDEYLQSRADAMQSIEGTIVELGGIFQQLAHMIKEQEEIMVRIDSNVEDTAMNVEAGHGELLKYFQSVTSNRWLMVKIFGVLIFFFIFFVIFMA